MKTTLTAFALFVSVALFADVDTGRLQADYPHWNLTNPNTTVKLAMIDDFISTYKGNDYLAGFDWDGTLYCEKITMNELPPTAPGGNIYGGQSGFYLWGACNKDKFTTFKIFPTFDTSDDQFKNDVIQKVQTVEGKLNDGMQNTSVPPVMPTAPFPAYNADGISKFSLETTMMLVGMTPDQLATAEKEYFKNYNPAQYAFLPMFDVLQKMCDSDFNVWIITGSSPYFVTNMLDYLDDNVIYKDGKTYDFSRIIISPDGKYDPAQSHLAGNGTKLTKEGTFSTVYDSRNLNNPYLVNNNLLFITDKQGKYVVINNIESNKSTKCAFIASNTDGDLYDTSYCLQGSQLTPNTFAICVAPPTTSQIYSYLQKFPNNSTILTMSEAYPQPIPKAN